MNKNLDKPPVETRYFYFNDYKPVSKTVEIASGDVVIDYCADGDIFGIEVLCNKERIEEVLAFPELFKLGEEEKVSLISILKDY